MMVRITDDGANIELTHGDALELLSQIGDMKGAGPKIRRLHEDLQRALWSRDQGARGADARVGRRELSK
jgi:hypothetical protein